MRHPNPEVLSPKVRAAYVSYRDIPIWKPIAKLKARRHLTRQARIAVYNALLDLGTELGIDVGKYERIAE